MFSFRPAIRAIAKKSEISVARRSVTSLDRTLIKTGKKDEPEDTLPVEHKLREMVDKDPSLIYDSGIMVPDPVLPDNPAEISTLDPAQKRSMVTPQGEDRIVTIRQMRARANQSPLNFEKIWKITFTDNGSLGNRWKNSLMGWNSTADPMQVGPPLCFANASDAVYFAKKRGWKYVVDKPIIRKRRSDGAQYQDNFLPQAIANQVKLEGTRCTQWERDAAGTSHYFRPLKYHGDGTVRQHGTNPHQDPEAHVDGYYKIR